MSSAFHITLLLPIGLYLTAHLFRCLRLYVLSLGYRRGGARLVVGHCLTAWASGLIPFKLGEGLRLLAFAVAIRSPFKGAAIWLIERLGDSAAILLMAFGFLAFANDPDSVLDSVLIAGLFLALCGMAAWTLSELLPFLGRDLVLRSRSKKGLLLLRLVQQVDAAFCDARTLLRGRFSLTFVISLVIWALEAASIYALAPMLGDDVTRSPVQMAIEGGEATALIRIPVYAVLAVAGGLALTAISWRARSAANA